MGKRAWWAAILLLAMATLQGVSGQALLKPPFGLHWGDSPEKLLAWAGRQALDVTISLPGDQPGLRVVRIEARRGMLPGTKAAAVEGRFLAGKLYELTVHYLDAEASADLMAARFAQLRRQLGAEHGALQANQQQRQVAEQFVTRTQSFHRETVKGLFLLLAFTEVEDLLRQTKQARFSLIYRNNNLREALAEELKQP